MALGGEKGAERDSAMEAELDSLREIGVYEEVPRRVRARFRHHESSYGTGWLTSPIPCISVYRLHTMSPSPTRATPSGSPQKSTFLVNFLQVSHPIHRLACIGWPTPSKRLASTRDG